MRRGYDTMSVLCPGSASKRHWRRCHPAPQARRAGETPVWGPPLLSVAWRLPTTNRAQRPSLALQTTQGRSRPHGAQRLEASEDSRGSRPPMPLLGQVSEGAKPNFLHHTQTQRGSSGLPNRLDPL